MWALAPQPCPGPVAPSPPCPGGCGPGVEGLFFQGGSGELGRLIVLFVSQSHAVMSAVTSCSALPIGLRCLPAGPASRPPNFPCTPRRSQRPGRGSLRAAGPRRAGRAEPAERSVAPRPAPSLLLLLLLLLPGCTDTWLWWPRRALRSRGVRPLETQPVRGLGSAGNPLVLPGNGCLRPGSCRSVPSFPWVFGSGETPVLPLQRPEEFGAQPGACPNTLLEFGCSLSSRACETFGRNTAKEMIILS